MKTAICYYSRHHGNTLKVLEAMTEGHDVELIDVTSRAAVRLELYDAIGFASGIYYGKFHDAVTSFARQYLPEGKDVFFVYTCGSLKMASTVEIAALRGREKCPDTGRIRLQGLRYLRALQAGGRYRQGPPRRRRAAKGQGVLPLRLR